MFFEATFGNAGQLLKTFGVLHELVHECSVSITPSGMSLQSMDASHVCLVSIVWPREKFLKYQSSGSLRVGIHVGNLLKVLKFSHKSDTVTMFLEESSSDQLTISFRDESRSAAFSLKLMDREDEEMGVPEIEYDAVISMHADEFLSVCKDMTNIADTLSVSIDARGMTLHASGDLGTATITYDKLEMMHTTELTQAFALRYLNSFAKGVSIAPGVSLKMCHDMPLVIEYSNDASTMTFYLAPKLDDVVGGDDGLDIDDAM